MERGISSPVFILFPEMYPTTDLNGFNGLNRKVSVPGLVNNFSLRMTGRETGFGKPIVNNTPLAAHCSNVSLARRGKRFRPRNAGCVSVFTDKEPFNNRPLKVKSRGMT